MTVVLSRPYDRWRHLSFLCATQDNNRDMAEKLPTTECPLLCGCVFRHKSENAPVIALKDIHSGRERRKKSCANHSFFLYFLLFIPFSICHSRMVSGISRALLLYILLQWRSLASLLLLQRKLAILAKHT